ncbi:Serine/threonine protein kinase [Amycolatopsis marina]|uniref:non-specific serine/threonine protein kinase n=1 Tax=Amycolatopsis marina TaxID=490629 RepID=A0A1I1BYG0_9PSEU|nr:serine/threonine-protein kinase [Amycolatopsis marina]SFB55484.1 Serine/threonine protein kinase [Amycolatopsis marina]
MTDEQGQQTRTTQTTPNAGAAQRVIAGRYALMGELGRGGMGVVWRAEDTVIGRHVAVKELRLPEGAEDAGVFQERVLREVRTGGRLNDPAVVTVYDVVTDADTTYIVMELVEAPTLSDLVRRNGPLAPHQVAMVGDQVLSALRAAHQAGIVHRDVKPGNIMVTSTGRVKLTDFGIAQAVDDPRLTTSGMLVGSPAFMAPERVAGREAMPASDLWALGATLYFAVEGTVAFERSSTAATLHAIMNEVPYLTHAQGPLASAIMGLLISTPEARITAEQAGGLLSMAAGQHGQSTPSGGMPTSVYPGQQPPPPQTMVAGHVMSGPAPAGPGSKAKRNGLLIGGVLAAVALLAAGTFLGKWIFGPAVDDAMKPTMTYGASGADIPSFETSSNGCLNVPLEQGRSIVSNNWIECDGSHDSEYFESVVVFYNSRASSDTAKAAYPDPARLRVFAESACSMAFHSEKVPAQKRAGLSYQALIPYKDAWEARGDNANDLTRRVYCMLSDRGGGQLDGLNWTQVR